jgi:hypothetical protein
VHRPVAILNMTKCEGVGDWLAALCLYYTMVYLCCAGHQHSIWHTVRHLMLSLGCLAVVHPANPAGVCCS